MGVSILRVCHLAGCPGFAEQFLDCRRRSACHEAGHALIVCLVTAKAPDRHGPGLARLVFGFAGPTAGEFSLPEETADSPWFDALMLLGGCAADAEMYGQATSEDGGDWARAKRLLEGTTLGPGPADALSVTRRLIARHQGALKTITGEVLRKGMVVGSEAWKLFQERRRNAVPASCAGKTPPEEAGGAG